MGLWSAYFLLKLVLYGFGYIDFHPWANLAFALFTSLTPKNARQRLSKNLIAVPVGIVLLYHDSWLPPIAQALSQAQNLRAFSAAYLWELAGRIVSWKLLLSLAAAFALYSLARRKLRMSTFAFLGILAVLIAPHGRLWLERGAGQTAVAAGTRGAGAEERNLSPEALDARLAQFYADQGKIQVHFARDRKSTR